MNDPGQRRLWSIPGDGVLARQGDLVLLVSIDDRAFAESLAELLARTSEAGGDGRALADAISAQVERHQSWGELRPGPAIVAFGPAGSGLAFALSGTAYADIGTSHGTHRLAAGHPSMLLRSVVGVSVKSVRAGLGSNGSSDKTDLFTRLDSGMVRASGLSYLSAQPDGPAAAPRSSAGPSFQPSRGHTQPSRELTQPSRELTQASREFTQPPREFASPPREFASPPREFASPSGEHTLPPVESPYRQPAPVPGEPGTGSAALQDLGLEEPGVTGPAPAPATSLGVPVRPEPEPAPIPDYAAAEAGEDAGSPMVFGVHCKNGHFTDPDVRSCVVCGTGINGISSIKRRSVPPQRGPRPPLGVLILDDGATLAVDGDYVIGRDPTRDQQVTEGQARQLRVVDAEQTVSRIHARVHLDGWRVMLTDLGSANGTRVQQPGEKTEQVLEPQVPVLLQPGARIFVGTPCIRYERAQPNGT